MLDLDDIFGGGGGGQTLTPAPQQSYAAPQAQYTPAAPVGDLLSDIFSTPAPTPIAASPLFPSQPVQNVFSVPQQPLAPPAPVIALNPVINVFEKNGFAITFELSKPSVSTPSSTNILVRFINKTQFPISNLVFQAAVPKYLKLEMLPPSSTTIPPNTNGTVTQEIRLNNSMQGEKSIMVKLKIAYSSNGQSVEEMVAASSFPPLY